MCYTQVLVVGEICVSTVLTPGAKLPLPHDTTTSRIGIPRRNELLHSHVAALENVKGQVFVVDEVGDVGTELFVEEDGSAIVRCSDDAEINKFLSSPGFIEADIALITSRCLMHTIDVATCENNVGLRTGLSVTGPVKVQLDNIVESFFDILGSKSTIKVIRG